MSHDFTGRVLSANGRAVPGVRVRVFDKDSPGKGDDDLTIKEGLSDDQGLFTVRFSPSRYLDFKELSAKLPKNLLFDWTRETRRLRLPDLTDVYLPYLKFYYSHQGQARTHTAFLRPFKREFRLPEATQVTFIPSQHGYQFVNRFKGYFIPFSVPAIPDLPSDTNIYGLCGGMVASSYDFLLAGRSIPPTDQIPKSRSPLHQYIYQRQNDSFGSFGEQIVRFARWMALPDGTSQGTQKKTWDEFEKIRASLDDGSPVPIGLVYESAQDTLQIWKNHQVLAVGYEEKPEGKVRLHIYDPNHPKRDDVAVTCERVSVGSSYLPGSPPRVATIFGLRGEQRIGGRKKKDVRGFFAMPYVPVEPPAGL